MIVESTDPVVTVELDARVVAEARRRYPGYLQHYPELYARGWSGVLILF